ncbi:MAG: hypothetical protein OHK93_005277 [Ramalina farinacea]|uniref:5-Methylcytosine G/T mismatch-specific DNA glycosylase n=1 Tax=Ramalina farinacea TaxID=258253 RepID=A0AA43U2D5_9LECA|nr:hypothetical protein [Ramalina farinacea]
MPTKIVKERDEEKDPESPRPKQKHRHKSSRSTHKTKKEKASTPPQQSTTSLSPTTKRRASVPETRSDRNTPSDSPLASKTSLPYPSFSKAHSKEAVGSRDNVAKPRLSSYYTPDPTDIEQGTKERDERSRERRKSAGLAPPSPPETTVEDKAKMEEREREREPEPRLERLKPERKKTDLEKAAAELKRKLTRSSSSRDVPKLEKSESTRSRNSHREGSREEGRSGPTSARNSKPGTPSKWRPRPVTIEVVDDTASNPASNRSFRKISSSSVHSSGAKSEAPTESTDSDATSIAPQQPNTLRPFTSQADRLSSSTLDADSEPKTPTASEPHYPPSRKETPAFSVGGRSDIFDDSPMPPPPPPPPPPEMIAPRVDYLIRNGGLSQEVPRGLLGAQPSTLQVQSAQSTNSVDGFFSPLYNVLDDYMKVISRNGSIAVATGYRSVARRLLDRLEAVFARDISSEACTCTICESSPTYGQETEEKQGVSWGEILEYVCGRQELPQWPPFVFDSFGSGLSKTDHVAPMQKLDIDVPEEFRAHYIRQSRKTKQTVDRWLESQPENPTSPPQDVDDETLTFAMLTRLEPDQRPILKSLLGVAPTRPASAAPTADGRATPLLLPDPTSLLQKTGLAIQRLYRLPTPPRDPESAIYLLSNPQLHNTLATLAAVNDHEWDILISGRFDGFLRSGAEESPRPTSAAPNHTISRGPTPSHHYINRPSTATAAGSTAPYTPPSRGPTPFATRLQRQSQQQQSSPASVGAPVALDEETEIATLAEVEREIYLGMEALEDAFEALHQKAEVVRSALRERGAGLMAQASQRRRAVAGSMSVLDPRMGTPASCGVWAVEGGESTDDDGDATGSEWGDGADGQSELAPDDSASNISRSRVRRPRRRTERRKTPAPVEEEDEEPDEGDEVVDVVAGGQDGGRGKERRKVY